MRPDKIRGNVFVANLPLGFTDEELAEVFDPYGIVLSAHLARDPATGETRGHGLVQLAPDKNVEAAVAALNDNTVAGRRVEVRRADPDMGIALPTRPRPPRAAPPPPPQPVVVMRSNAPRRLTTLTLSGNGLTRR